MVKSASDVQARFAFLRPICAVRYAQLQVYSRICRNERVRRPTQRPRFIHYINVI